MSKRERTATRTVIRTVTRTVPREWLLVGVTLMGACGSHSSFSGELFINEVLPSNKNSCADESGERNDWIELYNGGEQKVDLEGFSITDDTASLDKTRFGEGLVIAPKDVLLLWADKTPDQGPTHVDFKFKAKGEEIVLYDSEEKIIDRFTWADAVHDVSFARLPDGSGAFTLCASPTCGKKNGSRCAP